MIENLIYSLSDNQIFLVVSISKTYVKPRSVTDIIRFLINLRGISCRIFAYICAQRESDKNPALVPKLKVKLF